MDTFEYIKLRKELERDEGRRNRMYRDSVGVATIGIGWNLEANVLPNTIVDALLTISIDQASIDVRAVIPSFRELHPVRQRAMTNMVFNLGRTRLGLFKRMLKAIEREDWKAAAKEMLDSKWARQVGVRAVRLAHMMATAES